MSVQSGALQSMDAVASAALYCTLYSTVRIVPRPASQGLRCVESFECLCVQFSPNRNINILHQGLSQYLCLCPCLCLSQMYHTVSTPEVPIAYGYLTPDLLTSLQFAARQGDEDARPGIDLIDLIH